MIKEKPVPVRLRRHIPIRTFESSRRLVNGTPMQGAEASGYANQSLRAMIFRRREHMRKLVTVWIMLLALAAGLTAADKPGNTGEFKTIIQHYWEAWSTLNPDNAASMYAKEADTVFFDLAPLKYNGWEEYSAGVKKVFAARLALRSRQTTT